MTRESEKVFKEFHKFIEDKDLSEEEIDDALKVFIEGYNKNISKASDTQPKSADDYLDLAYSAETAEESIIYAKKALKIDKNCIDAKMILIEENDDLEKAKLELEKAIILEEKRLKNDGFFNEDDKGIFYGIVETRPYMRARVQYVLLLIELRKIKKAISECNEIIDLNNNDNTGMRYILMALYALMEDVDGAQNLYDQFEEDSFRMLFPMALLYYKLDDYKQAKKILIKIKNVNSDYVDLINRKIEIDDDEIDDVVSSGMYSPNTIDEVAVSFEDNELNFEAFVHFNDWARKELKTILKEKSGQKPKKKVMKK